MLTHSYYEEDPRVRREAETLVAAGRPVEVFALRRPGDAVSGELSGVRVHRLDVQRHQGAGLRTYLSEYAAFCGRAGWAATQSHRRRAFALVQVHTLPDFLVFAGVHFRLARVPLVLDLHEAMPEFFRMRFPRASNPVVHRLLVLQELAAIAAADAAITVNDALADRLVDLGVDPRKITVVLNSPDLTRFDPRRFPERAFMADGTLRLVYAGALTPTYEIDILVEAVVDLRRRRPGLPVTLDLYGRGDADGPLRALVEARSLSGAITFHGRIPIEDVPAAIARADLGAAPTRRSPFTDFSLSTKIFEYAAMGKPVVASRLPMVERTFAAGSVATYEPGDPAGLADAILRLVDDAAAREAGVAATAERVRELSWAREGERYRALVEGLIQRHGGAGLPGAGLSAAYPAR
ncbi:MAG TPA: glycosyltransferase family 4 protein [Candidatus Saccharimonadales bacterium]|nr:glycosyltransferase family 4 protein [Candidatus Saccharimonadales bacterium]